MKRQRFEPVAKVINDATQAYGLSWGKRVLENAKSCGMRDEEIEVMRERMNKWMKLVRLHEKEMLELMNDPGPGSQKVGTARAMRESLDRCYQEVFG